MGGASGCTSAVGSGADLVFPSSADQVPHRCPSQVRVMQNTFPPPRLMGRPSSIRLGNKRLKPVRVVVDLECDALVLPGTALVFRTVREHVVGLGLAGDVVATVGKHEKIIPVGHDFGHQDASGFASFDGPGSVTDLTRDGQRPDGALGGIVLGQYARVFGPVP